MGNIQILRNFHSYIEQITRTIRIFTPDAYTQHPDQSFPVLYMFDGQNIFSHPESAMYDTWCANTTMEALVKDGSVRPWIIVGIDSTSDRMIEYSPWLGDAAISAPNFCSNNSSPTLTRLTEPCPNRSGQG